MKQNHKIRVLFVCMGNICRSPTADGVFSSLVHAKKMSNDIHVDSAGTHEYHIGNHPDQRAQATAKNNNVDISHSRARKVIAQDFIDFDYIIAMDNENVSNLMGLKQDLAIKAKASIHLFMEFAPKWSNEEVPDPYYGGPNGFDEVFKMITDASEGLLKQIVSNVKK